MSVSDLETTAVDHAPLLERAFESEPREGSYEVTNVQGEIPPFLAGTYYLNGPARFARGGVAYRHWLDGDGMVCALRFAEGRAHFTNRFVRTAKLVEEEAAGRPLYRTFGTTFPGDQLQRGVGLASPANVSVYPYAGTLLALGEQGLPWELDPLTLETRGEYTFGGAVNAVSPFAAHPKIDPATGELVNFGINFSSTQPSLNLYRFNASGRALGRKRVPLPDACTLHDFGLSPRYAIFHLSPYRLDMGRLLGGSSLMDALVWEPERGSRLLVVGRESGEIAAEIPVGLGHVLHLVNCFEEGDRLTVDVIELEEPIYDEYQPLPNLFGEVTGARPVRFVIDLARGWANTRASDRSEDGPSGGARGQARGRLIERRAISCAISADFPSLDTRLLGRPYEHLWLLGISKTGKPGRKFFDRLLRCDWTNGEVADFYQAPPRHYLGGEPAFIPTPGSAPSGIVLCQQFDAERRESSFALFDAFDLAGGPIALLRLDSPVHLGFHACWHPDFDADRTEQLWRW